MRPPTTQELRCLILNYWYVPLLLIFLLLLGWYLFFGGPGRQDKLEDKIAGEKGVNAAIANLIANQEVEVNKAHADSYNSETNFNLSVNRDSSTFSGNTDVGTDTFCRRFKCDGSCYEWRQKHFPTLFCKGDAER